MTKVLLISDIHGEWEKAKKILEKEKYDISINLGDSEISQKIISKNFDYFVKGNMDFDFNAKEEELLEIENIKIAICHGHTRGIYIQDSIKEAVEFGKEMQAKIVIHGHSHKIRHKKSLGIDVICPGSISYPRTPFGPSYMILTLDYEKIINLEWKKI